MNKKFLSAVLFGALMVSSTGTFVSCKDYDDDIDQINKELTDIKSAIADLKTKVESGKYVTNVVKEGDGIKITWNDNSTSTIETIKGADGAAGKNGTLVTIVDGYWAFDGVKSDYPAKGDKGEDGAAAAAGHDAKISDGGYWMVWDATANNGAGAYVTTEYIAGGATAVAGAHGWTINVRDDKGEMQSIYIPNSADLLSVEPVNAQDGCSYSIYYGILNAAVDWDGHKAVNKKMEAGMYPTLDRDINILLNPAGVDGQAYKFDFRASDNVELWGLTFGEVQPYEGDKITMSRATSANAVWTLPRDIQRVELDVYNAKRAAYITQFKKNDNDYYSFAVNATSVEDDSKIIRSQYEYTFNPLNIGNLDASKFHNVSPQKDEYTWNTEHKPNFDGFTFQNGATELMYLTLSNVIYDYKLDIDRTQMSQVDIDKYGLEIVDNGYKFIVRKEAAVDNPIYLTVKYILVNGSQATKSFSPKIIASDIEVVNGNIGSIDSKFNASLLQFDAAETAIPAELNGKYVYSETIKFNLDEKLGANKDQWIDAMYKGISREGTDYLKKNAILVGGDPINNVAEYNTTLLNNLIYFDYVDKDGKSCIYNQKNLLTSLQNIEGLKVYFIASTLKFTSEKWVISQTPVKEPFYTIKGSADWNGEGNGFAIPLNNAFSVTLPAKKEGQTVASLDFTFQLTMPDNCPIKRETVGNQTSKWNEDKNVVTVYGEKNGTNVNVDMRDAFTGAFVVTEGKDPINNTYSYSYGKMKPEAAWYKVTMERHADDNVTTIIGSSVNAPKVKSLANITGDSHYENWNTFAPIASVFANNATRPTFTTSSVVYEHFGVYPQGLDGFTIVFASKVEDSQKAGVKAKGAGTADQPIEAKATYNDDRTIKQYSFSVGDGTFAMTDAFDNAYSLFDASNALRATLHAKLIENRQGIEIDPATFYGMHPVVTVDGNAVKDIIPALTKVEIKDKDDKTKVIQTYYTGMEFTIPASYGVDKVIKVTYNVTDVFGTVKSFDFYARTVNKEIGNDDKKDEDKE